MIDRKPSIKDEVDAQIIEDLHGEIELKNIYFSYPSRKNVTILKNVNLTFKRGEKTALVGPTGCGKSSIIQLIERFYDVDGGSVCLDGVNIKDLKLEWYRRNIGYVG